MMHRALPVAVLLGLLPGLLAARAAGAAAPATPPTGDLVLAFEDIETFARAASPRLRVLAQEVAAEDAARRQALQWSNPAVAFDHEKAHGYREWQVTLAKRIDRPLTRGDLGAGWDGRVEAAELQRDQAARELLAELKTGYVALRLQDDHLARLERLGELVDLVATAAAGRRAEGTLSAVDHRLLRLAAYTVDSATLRVRQERRRQEAAWRADMGIAPDRPLVLATPVVFHDVRLAGAAAYLDALADAPGTRAPEVLAQALARQADAARPGLLPGIDLYGGYRRYDPDVDGWVAGVAVDLPLFDRGAGEAGGLEAERRIVASEGAAARARAAGEVAALVVSLRESRHLLSGFADRVGAEPLADALLQSFQEGDLTLDELLGAVEVEAGALQAHHDDLAAYYAGLFRLEALTGAEVVGFDAAEQDRAAPGP